MRIPNQMRWCTGFLIAEAMDGKQTLVGTIFFVANLVRNGSYSFSYAVTAKHNIDGINEKGIKEAIVKINSKNGTLKIRTEIADWIFHPTDQTTDVAVLPWVMPEDSEQFCFPIQCNVEQDNFKRIYPFDIGDEVFLMGLFARANASKFLHLRGARQGFREKISI